MVRSGLLWIETRSDQARNAIHTNRLHVRPFLGRLRLPWFREHVVDPSRSLGFGYLNEVVMKKLAIGILLTGGIGALARWKSGIEQYVRPQIVDEQVCVAPEPFGILVSEPARARMVRGRGRVQNCEIAMPLNRQVLDELRAQAVAGAAGELVR